uniref:Phospholipase A2 n=1 Tax=Pseudonaja textilis TaxID=8673 RepID=A0A670Y4I4_PSETE
PFHMQDCNLTPVTIFPSYSIVTESDCYVSLTLPTSSSEVVKTETVPNSKNPEWNQAFTYRIDSRIKNTLHLKLCDEDQYTKDDHLYTVLFDVGKLRTGQITRVSFKLNPEVSGEMVQFTTLLLILFVFYSIHVEGDLTLTVKGSFEETQKILLGPDSSQNSNNIIQFHCIKNHQSNLEIELPTKMYWSKVLLSWRVLYQYGCIAKYKLLYFRPKELDERLGYDLCAEEQDFLRKRRKYVAAAIKKTLQLQKELKDDEVPVIAVMTTGGGTRSFTAMYGSLLGLQKLNLLDCLTYLTGLSGTTWTMCKLYEDPDWSQKYLEEAINKARRQVTKSKFNCFSSEKLKYYYNELNQKIKEGHSTSFIDLWGLIIESMFHDGVINNHTLSDQRMAVNEGQNPLPIYLAVNLKDNYSAQDFKEWLEFTPYEVGSMKYGAYIRSEDFGNEFFMGRLMKKFPEIRICFMQGMWSSIFSLDLIYFWNVANDSEEFWHRWTRDRIQDIDDSLLPSKPHELHSRLLTCQSQLSSSIRDVLTRRPTIAEYPNFLRGFQFHDEYLKNIHFSAWKDSVLDSQPNLLMETAEQPLSLVDTGFFINTSYPPLLKPERRVDVILHLNYSGGAQTFNLDQFSKYASELGVPFPKTEISEEDKNNLKECYVFEDTENAAAPLVLFFPLTNDTFKAFEAPGVERLSTNMEEGNVDVSSFFSPFGTREVSFSEDNFDKLVKLAEYNILNNENKIIEAFHAAVYAERLKCP